MRRFDIGARMRVDRIAVRSRMHRALAVAVVVVGLVAGVVILAVHRGGDSSANTGEPTGAYLVQGPNSQLDDQALRLMASHAKFIAVGTGTARTSDGEYGFRQIAARLKQFNPAVRVLVYSTASLYYRLDDLIADRKRAEYLTVGRVFDTPQWVLGTARQYPGSQTLLGDVRQASYRKAVADTLSRGVDELGADGVVLDSSFRSPTSALSAQSRDPRFVSAYQAGMDALLAEIKRRMGDKLVFFNGLWNNVTPGMLADQQRLLRYVDGATIEYFGTSGDSKATGSFATEVLPYLRAIQAHPDKTFLVFGRNTSAYADYSSDYLRQRFLYASYLLVRRENTFFKYHGSFATTPLDSLPNLGRSFGLDTFADSELDLGAPDGGYRLTGGVYSRRYEKGMVIVAPSGGSFGLPRPFYTPEGARLRGTVRLEPNEALLLVDAPPAAGARSFSTADAALDKMPAAAVKQADGRRFLSLQPIERRPYQHDLLLDPVRRYRPPRRLSIELRTADPQARLLIAAEVDDPQRSVTSVVLSASADGQLPPAGQRRAIRYRLVPPSAPLAPYRSAGPLPVTGRWVTVNVDPDELVKPYTFRRWIFLRPLGAMDLGRISFDVPFGALSPAPGAPFPNTTIPPVSPSALPGQTAGVPP